MAREKKAEKKVREDNSGVDFEFASGAVLPCAVEDLPDDVKTQLMLHGISQKVGDSYSGASSPDEAFKFASGTWERLKEGKWQAAREGGGGKRTTVLVEALHIMFESEGKTLEDCQTLVAGLDDEQVKGLEQHPQVKAAKAKVTAARAAKKAEAAAAELEGNTDVEPLNFG